MKWYWVIPISLAIIGYFWKCLGEFLEMFKDIFGDVEGNF